MACWKDPLAWNQASSRLYVCITSPIHCPLEKLVYEMLKNAQMKINMQTTTVPACSYVVPSLNV